MTVQEMIDQLEKIEDKTRKVIISYSVSEPSGVYAPDNNSKLVVIVLK